MTAVMAFNQLYSVLGTWAKVEEVTGIQDRLRRKIMNEPLRAGRCKPEILRRLARALRKHCRFPLKDDFLLQSREKLTELKSEPGTFALESYIFVLDKYLKTTRPAEPEKLVEYLYMEMLVDLAKALQYGDDDHWFGGLDGTIRSLQLAEKNAVKGIYLAEDFIKSSTDIEMCKRISHLRAFLFINWMQIKQEQVKGGFADEAGHIMSRSELSSFFEKERAFPELDKIISKYPFLWQAVYNGLEQASYVENYLYALRFYRKLRKLDSNFKNFEYNPGEVLPLCKEPGMVYFVEWYKMKLGAGKMSRKAGKIVKMEICTVALGVALFLGKASTSVVSFLQGVGTGV